MPTLCHVIKKIKRGTPGEEWLNCVPCVNYRALGQNNSIMRSGWVVCLTVHPEGEQGSNGDED